MDKLNINKLKETNRRLHKNREKTYNEVKRKLYNKIMVISKTGKTECWYYVPNLIIGYPPIDSNECSQFIIKKLKEEPIEYTYYEPNLFHVWWT
jgi:hypothetical protein